MLDSSCSFKSSYNIAESYVGSAIGYCTQTNRACSAEGIVNMGSVSFFAGSTQNVVSLGGIAGDFTSGGNSIRIKNCANYGSVTFSIGQGGTNNAAYIGGIAGKFTSTSILESTKVTNCLNYGEVSCVGTTDDTNRYIGGIVGFSSNAAIENCLNGGGITINGGTSTTNAGGIVGRGGGSTTITHCFWTSGPYAACDDGCTADGNASRAKLNATTMSELNNYATDKNNNNNGECLCKWKMLHLNGGKINSHEDLIVIQSNFPVPVKDGSTFSFWCTDADCSEMPNGTKATNATDLYAMWDTLIVTLNAMGGNISGGVTMKVVLKTGSYGELPNATKTGYRLDGWFTDATGRTMRIEPSTNVVTPSDHTLYAHWSPEVYVVRFEAEGGAVDREAMNVTYNSTYGDLPTATNKAGHTFLWWHIGGPGEEGERVESNTTVTTAKDHTLCAQWAINNYTLTFDYGNGTTAASETLSYNSTIKYPANPEREGYNFTGWNPNPKTMPANDTTVVAQWTMVSLSSSSLSSSSSYSSSSPTSSSISPHFSSTHSSSSPSSSSSSFSPSSEVISKYVEIVIGTKDLTEEEVKEIIKKHVDGEVYIEKLEKNEKGETTIIIRFKDSETAQNFVDAIKEASNAGFEFVSISFLSEGLLSFATRASVPPFALIISTFNALLLPNKA